MSMNGEAKKEVETFLLNGEKIPANQMHYDR
jgi:hypothetical protein